MSFQPTHDRASIDEHFSHSLELGYNSLLATRDLHQFYRPKSTLTVYGQLLMSRTPAMVVSVEAMRDRGQSIGATNPIYRAECYSMACMS